MQSMSWLPWHRYATDGLSLHVVYLLTPPVPVSQDAMQGAFGRLKPASILVIQRYVFLGSQSVACHSCEHLRCWLILPCDCQGAHSIFEIPAGNTTVDVRGNVFRDGSHLLCNFSSLEAFRHNHDQGAASPHLPDLTFRGLSNATLRGDDTLRCVSPLQWNTTKATTSAYGARPFEVALNGQQFTDDGVAWAWLPTAHVSFVYPASGVVGGGTVVTVTGAGFGYGCAPRCDFESVAPREWNSRHERSGRAVVNATYDEATDKWTKRCACGHTVTYEVF